MDVIKELIAKAFAVDSIWSVVLRGIIWIVIAMIIFTLLLVSSFVISRNYGNKSIENIARSGAISVAIKIVSCCV